MICRSILTLIGLILVCEASAQVLSNAFVAAQAHDPLIRAAMAERAAAQQNYPMARSALLPQIGFTWSDTQIKGTETVELGGRAGPTPFDYRAPVKSLSLRMPVYNREALQKLNSAKIQVAYAEQVFVVKLVDLLERLTSAWLQAWLARENVAIYDTAVRIAEMKSAQAKSALAVGEVSKVDSDEAAASLTLAQAQLQEAHNQYQLSIQAYVDIAGTTPPSALATRRRSPPPSDLISTSLCHVAGESRDAILLKAADSNPSVGARQLAVELSRKVLTRNESGHYPRLDFIASVQDSRNESLSTLDKRVEQQSIGFQFSLPLFSGGYVSSTVTQAAYEIEKTQAELDAEIQNTGRTLRRAYFGCVDNANRALAQARLWESYQASQVGLNMALKAGMASQSDVIAGEQRILQTWSGWAQAMRDMGIAAVQLVTRTGTAPQPVLSQIEALTAPPQ